MWTKSFWEILNCILNSKSTPSKTGSWQNPLAHAAKTRTMVIACNILENYSGDTSAILKTSFKFNSNPIWFVFISLSWQHAPVWSLSGFFIDSLLLMLSHLFHLSPKLSILHLWVSQIIVFVIWRPRSVTDKSCIFKKQWNFPLQTADDQTDENAPKWWTPAYREWCTIGLPGNLHIAFCVALAIYLHNSWWYFYMFDT